MTDRAPALVLRADDIQPFTDPAEPGYHSQHVLGQATTGLHDLLLNRGTVDPHAALHGTNHPDNDEVYYVVSGSAVVDLGGDPWTGVGGETFRVEPDTVVFIPAGTFHRLRNDADAPLVLLTEQAKFDPEGPARQVGPTAKPSAKAKTPPRRPDPGDLVVDGGRRVRSDVPSNAPRPPKSQAWRRTASRFLTEWDSMVTATTPGFVGW
jgi:mannose-6-phosphate isomerase-like protein (cupin superfamily)